MVTSTSTPNDNQGDNWKPLVNKESDRDDNCHQSNKEEQNNLPATVKSGATLGIENPPRNAHQDNQKVKSVAPKQINWKSYPFNSRNQKSLQERAGKVKERILGCGTSNELIKLQSEGKISEQEITWLKENVLTQAEREQVKATESTRQGNLFWAEDSAPEVVHYDYNEVIKGIDAEMKRLNWSKGEGKDYLVQTYGVKSRVKLSDGQLVEFWNYLKAKG